MAANSIRVGRRFHQFDGRRQMMQGHPKFSFQRLRGIIAKEFLQMRRDRLTFAMMLGIPLIQLTLFGYAINSDPRASARGRALSRSGAARPDPALCDEEQQLLRFCPGSEDRS